LVAPIVDLGPTSSTRFGFDSFGGTYAQFYARKHRRRQAKPFNLVLPYDAIYNSVLDYQRSSSIASVSFDANDGMPYTLPWVSVENLSYERLRAKIYDRVAAGVDFAEHRQAIGMIVSTATTLLNTYLAVRQGRFGDAAKALRMKFLPKRVSKFKSAGNNWLEFHFGWEPLIGDMYDAIKVIADPVKSYSLERGRATIRGFKQTAAVDYGSVIESWTANGSLSVTQGVRLKFASPGASHTLDQWGINNPLVIAWELVPFSFVVDWFVNVGDFLQSQTDFTGLTLESVFRSYKSDMVLDVLKYTKPGFFPAYTASCKIRSIESGRYTSLSGVSLEVRKIKPLSLVRGATAISLLLQQLYK
jgi:hypothetical protein